MQPLTFPVSKSLLEDDRRGRFYGAAVADGQTLSLVLHCGETARPVKGHGSEHHFLLFF